MSEKAVLMVTIMWSVLSFLNLIKKNREKLINRKNMFLCYYSLDHSLVSYVSRIEKINMQIISNNFLKINPKLRVLAKIYEKFLIQKQNIIHLSYWKKTLLNNHCSIFQRKDYIKNLPYKTISKVKLSRSLIQTTITSKKRWTNKIKTSLGLSVKYPTESFSINVKYRIQARRQIQREVKIIPTWGFFN